MEILSKWRDAGRLDLRKNFEDAIAKAPGPKAPARLTFLRSITQTHGTLFALCSAASPAERGAILRYSSNAAISMWRQGAWPSALGLQIAALNVASRFVTGADAAYVLAESDKIIEEAARTQNLAGGDVSRAGSWSCTPLRAWCRHVAKGAELVCGSSPKRCAKPSRPLSPKSPNKRCSYLAWRRRIDLRSPGIGLRQILFGLSGSASKTSSMGWRRRGAESFASPHPVSENTDR